MPTAHEIAQSVRRRIGRRKIEPRVSLEVDGSRIDRQSDLWFVPIRPSIEPRKLSKYFMALAEIETALQLKDELNVTVVPLDAEPVRKNPRASNGK